MHLSKDFPVICNSDGLFSRTVKEFDTEKNRTSFHLAAEFKLTK